MKVSIGPYKDEGVRKEQVMIHDYDTWNMDNTLALIILPMLKQLKEQKNGSPIVDQEDAPTYLRTTYPAMYGDQLDLFNTYEELGDLENDPLHARWDWVLNEMIWSFEQYEKDDFYFITGDRAERLQNGFRLFGKYFMSLWS